MVYDDIINYYIILQYKRCSRYSVTPCIYRNRINLYDKSVKEPKFRNNLTPMKRQSGEGN